ncbi:Hexaprenyldihydroxybenzoate methyltransferase, mitochondrial [Actinomortierella ambigua]|nr:Hexaprenyldihydroxybenzoate methyltransferase, mitochondrial [Actinomortierella ambigua]
MTVGKSAMPRLTSVVTVGRFGAQRPHLVAQARVPAIFTYHGSTTLQGHPSRHTSRSSSVGERTACRSFSTSIQSLHSEQSPTSSNPIDTVNEDEIAKFAAMSDEWWAPHGPFKMLHLMNPPRIRYIRNRLEASGALKHNPLSEAAESLSSSSSTTSSSSAAIKYSTSRYPLQGLRILDVGCGGGLLSEALARLGAQVTGLDASNENVQMAQKLVANGLQYDVVCSMEVIEHVDNPAGFLQCLGQLVRPGGDLLLSTISRTPFAYLTTIWAAENLLRFVPVGTHHYEKYIRPEELEKGVRDLTNCVVLDVQGVGFNPLAGQWQLLPKPTTSPFYDGHAKHAASDDAGLLGRLTQSLGLSEACNYFLAAKKPRAPTPSASSNSSTQSSS